MEELRRTPLTAWHERHGAKLVPFAGWLMPVQYEGIVAEHLHARAQASLFDICHMGEFRLSGQGALAALERLVTHDLRSLPVGRCRYGFMLNPQGGVLDDLIIYRLAEDEFMLVVNGACAESDFKWIKTDLPRHLSFEDVSDATAKIDLQGPASLAVLEGTLGVAAADLTYFSFKQATWRGTELLISRTGYTGELGFELYLDASRAEAVWDQLLTDERAKPAGLGARDTLRLEAGLPLYGQDLDAVHTPVEAGLGMFVKSKADFVGHDKLGEVFERRVALEIPGRRSARHHDLVLLPTGEQVGVITSGSFAPSLGHCVALAFIQAEHADDSSFRIQTQRALLEARPAGLPFYKGGTARMKTS